MAPARAVAGEWIAIALLAAAALALRLPTLGHLGLVADEGHQALAVAGILERGVPSVPSGAVYLRGGPFLYSEAVAARLFGLDEMSLRLPAALFSVASVFLLYVYGRMLFGVRTGLIAALLLTFSLWELELSHYARMYTLLQLGFLGSAIAIYRDTVQRPRGYRASTYALLALTLLTHHLGILVLLFLLVPAFLPDETLAADRVGRGRWQLMIPALILGIFWLSYHELESRLIVRAMTPASDAFTAVSEEEVEAATASATAAYGPVVAFVREHLLIPPITLPWDLRGRDRPAVAAALGLAAGLGLAAATALAAPGRVLRTLWALAILGAAFVNLFALALALAAGYLVFLPRGLHELGRRPLAPALVGTGALALYWGLYLLRHPEARVTGWGEPHSIPAALFGYPPVGHRALSWLIQGWPMMTAVVAVTLVVLLVRFALDRRRAACLYAAATILLPLLAATMTREIHNESRYLFHLYPFLILLFALALGSGARFLTGIADTLAAIAGRRFRGRRAIESVLATGLILLLSPDAAPGEIARFLKRDYGSPKDPVRAVLNWRPYATFHQDHRGPAERVRAELDPEDRIVVAGPTYWASIYWHYIGRVDYVVSEQAMRLIKNGVAVHHVTGARCIVNVGELEQMLAAESGRRIWILADRYLLGDDSRTFSTPMKARLRALTRNPVFVGRDLDTFVARRDPGPIAGLPVRAAPP